MEDILKQFPPSSVNNSRSIVKKKLEGMKNHPSESRKQELENMVDGISIDFTPADAGEEPIPLNPDDYNAINDEEPF